MALIDLDTLNDADVSLRAMAGIRVSGTTAGGTDYTGTVSPDRAPRLTCNRFVVIDVDGGGWTRSDAMVNVLDTATEADNGVTVTLEYAADVAEAWQVTVTDTETDETLAQWSTGSFPHALTLRENALECDMADLL